MPSATATRRSVPAPRKLRSSAPMTERFAIGGRPVGAGEPIYVIAEAGSNHNRDLDSREAPHRRRRGRRRGRSQVPDVLRQPDLLATHAPDRLAAGRVRQAGARADGGDLVASGLAAAAWPTTRREREIAFFSTPFDHQAVDELDAIGVPAIKIASFEIGDLPLIAHAAATGRPLIISTGMATLGEIEEALGAAAGRGRHKRRATPMHFDLSRAGAADQSDGDGHDGSGVPGPGRPLRSHDGHGGSVGCRGARRDRPREALHARPDDVRPRSLVLARARRAEDHGGRDS